MKLHNSILETKRHASEAFENICDAVYMHRLVARHGYKAGKDMAKDPRGARKVGTRRDQPQCDRLSLPLHSSHA